ncbi:MAG: translation initiation factor IF-3 [Pseudomonadota bacterium]|jgi:translation initiation factor IF-3|nr:translation initiation factor IF-3 [Pseudomonadota bacterium]|tara:strand:+ start:201 stop:725 length:525 start_codon:yes stop_codon:yes gene_type:complete
MRSSSKKPIINEFIEADEVRLVGADGSQVGVVSIEDALAAAEDAKLDLVLIAPDADPQVCKIMDYGKHVFDLKKQKAANKKKQRRVHVKEIKFRPGTEEGDYQVKLRNLIRFLTDGDKAKVSLRFRGRELAHQHLGQELIERIKDDLSDYGTVEQEPKMEGRQIVMVLAPVKKR